MRVVQWILALVFAITAGLKVAMIARGAPAGGTSAVVTMFSALPAWEQWAVVVAELILAVWLATGWRGRWGAFAVIVLLSGFMGAVIVEMGKPIPHPCGCFGALSGGSPLRGLWITLSMDAFLLLGALWIYFKALPRVPRSAGPDAPSP
jgi:hypothetical protein